MHSAISVGHLPAPSICAEPGDDRTVRVVAVARAVAERLAGRGTISRQALKSLMTEAYGASDAAGAWSMRDAYDALEAAQLLRLLSPAGPLSDQDALPARLHALDDVARALPPQTYRSEQQVELQQFSTPLPLAWLVAVAAAMTDEDIVLEPSAGIGMLAVHARRMGAALILNERDPGRAGLLTAVMGQPVSRHDAEFIDDMIDPDCRPTVVLINPPFGRSEGRGLDRHAAARHLRSALLRLAPGGRCVAIMPPSFAPDGAGATSYQSVCAVATPRAEITLEGKPFARQGASITVRLCVFDKGWSGCTERHLASSFADALPIIAALPPRLALAPREPDPASVRVSAVIDARPPRSRALLGGLGGVRRLAAPPVAQTLDATPQPLAYELLAEVPAADEPVGIYVPWRLTRIAFPEPNPHPDQLVESVAMSSILPPVPHYHPLLPPSAAAALSDAQREAAIYAGQAFERDLPGLYVPDAAGTALLPGAEGQPYRMGYMVGDGTGVGKGQQVAACILDRWCRGHRKALWISKSAALIEDARRDWSALGGLPIDMQPLDAFPLGSDIPMESGILFLTYATLRSQRDDAPSRLQQILRWLGTGFAGLLAFDEAHELANAAGAETIHGKQKGSEQGLAGVRLQNMLPRACILYNSATGATDPANLCYATRLGLWGQGTAFETREAFMAAIASGGIAAMEIVARDLKALGLYTARSLTFRGVEYAPLEHVLTEDQIRVYDAYADAWSIIHRRLDEVLEATNIVDRMTGRSLNAQAKGAALSRFESAKQLFFGQVLIAMKLPTLFGAIEHHLARDHHVVIQLVTTAEAMLERRLAGLGADERANLEIELSPREYMVEYLKTAFPTRMLRVFKGTDGEPRSEIVVDAAGHPIHSQEALRARDDLIEQLCAMPAIPSALDAIISRFGTDLVAEVTGRSRRLLTDMVGRQRIERRTARSNIAEADAFMAGAKRILIFSDAGGTGRSYHADRKCPTAHRRRAHFLLEPGWRASNAIQGLGRSNRTDQQSAPIFIPAATNCWGERRFISTIARRLDSLGALTRGQRQAGGQNLFDPADNLESDYAKDALQQWYRLLHRGKLKSTSLADYVGMTGLKLVNEDSGELLDKLPPIQRWLNRLLALRIATQNAIFEEYFGLIQARIQVAREAGTLDVGVETILADEMRIVEEQVLRCDPVSGAETKLCRIELKRRRRATALPVLLDQWRDCGDIQFLRNERSGRVALRVPSWSILDDDGQSIRIWELIRPTGSDRIRESRLAASHWQATGKADFARLWQAECEMAAQEVETSDINVATGLLLPVWDKLPDDDVRVWRIADQAGNAVLGRIVSPAGLERLAATFGINMEFGLTPAEIIRAARSSEGVAIPGLEPARLRRALVNDEPRLEIMNYPPDSRARLKALGCFTEIIAYKTRVFVPPKQAEAIIAAIGEPMASQAAA
ncbi:strawberry notch-like NTP hydrolase domain-containing protein [Sphingopyxis sp. H050]|uniref:strawberry notch-like NTP hydrolase domain-containing protein n=1 Tax=Sphingopyxis sp. H050 TaxID=1759072 RepID=UPI0009EAEF04|nr:strawberry notch family protein [Sphingopyxis sp. H050]